ncbi:acireductone dioxygenase-like [Paramacrobiotus metropolitanus]|uniref:acireductone dioxygenase-like n=1 Tax=Paramacrobiotus metropolitanus TaxID=2943436 RepID=UPI0024462746|nr:acireductone dioxygenase-like [Paramacrobiotus metropolitanus]
MQYFEVYVFALARSNMSQQLTNEKLPAKCQQSNGNKPHAKTGWYLRDTILNRYEENKTDPPEYLTDEQIYLETENILSWIDLGSKDDPVEWEKRARAVRNMPLSKHVECDISKEKDEQAVHEKADKFFNHHFHVGEVMRVVTEGSGYYDVMDLNGRWIRRPISKGDVYVIPSGCYHRVCLDTKKHLNVVMMHYDKKSTDQFFWPESLNDPVYIEYNERMKCLRRSLSFPYQSRPGFTDCVKSLNRP